MKQCNCRHNIDEQTQKFLKVDNGCIVDFDLISGRTFSTFKYEKEVNGRKRKKELIIAHTYCPFCGKKYKTED